MLRKCTIHSESAQETSAAGAQEKIRPLRNRRKSASRREGSTTVQAARKQVKGNTRWTEALQPPERGAHQVEEVGGVVAKNQDSSETCHWKGAGRDRAAAGGGGGHCCQEVNSTGCGLKEPPLIP